MKSMLDLLAETRQVISNIKDPDDKAAMALQFSYVEHRYRMESRITGVVDMFCDWDAIVATEECRHCDGTGEAPGNGKTECGFCEQKAMT